MELWLRISWAALALLHIPPAAVVLAPSLAERLYGVSPSGDAGILIVHRGALFLAVAALAAFATVDTGSRRAASIVLVLSIVGYLVVYARAGLPAGALRTIALADLAALLPLTLVTLQAWRSQPPL